ncbi:hypothetical protein A7A08_03015 [Methyloligella halotolerans]|uniref:Uncharacterized protein n=1 Tax=Methyloligella halotolerans TaxID=1177755 RepID=A0A1E2RVI1_9HYPH|nr:hypothetical protein A7A08_03015 [Methyloligella halotolerans]
MPGRTVEEWNPATGPRLLLRLKSVAVALHCDSDSERFSWPCAQKTSPGFLNEKPGFFML